MTSKKPRLTAQQVKEIQRRASPKLVDALASPPPPNRAARRARARRRYLTAAEVPRDQQRADLGEDGVGYFADTFAEDDCFRAAIATATQIPIEQVPDLRLHGRLEAGDDPDEVNADAWHRITTWLDRRGLELTFHESVPADRERWIGICEVEATPDNPFTDHCLVMSYARVIFDPSANAHAPTGMRPRTWRRSDVTYGLSFDQKEKSNAK